jgi:KipI family sensor histidine kinase inhibitor
MYYKIAGIDSIIISLGEQIDEVTSSRLLNLYKTLQNLKLEGMREMVPSYTTLFIQFDIRLYSHQSLYDTIENLEISDELISSQRLLSIPVYYGKEVGIDLERVASLNDLSIDEVIEIHSSQIYQVYAIGFAPAFGYMGKVDTRIITPRLKTPRAKIPAKSVAIADFQTAIYPKASPGGWNILGATSIDIFDKSLEGFSYFQIGDKVKFEPISQREFLKSGGKIC